MARGRTSRLIAGWVDLMARHALAVIVFGVVFTLVIGVFAATHLDIDTDNADLISRDVDWRQDYIAYQKAFPVYADNLVVVIDGATPGVTDDAVQRLAAAMRQHSKLFNDVYVPGGGDFFARNGLLYLDTDALSQLAQRLTRIQPLLGRLSADPTLVTFFSLLGEAMQPDAPVDVDLAPILHELRAAFGANRRGTFHRLDWQTLMGGDTGPGISTQRFILVKPKLDYGALLPGQMAMTRIGSLAAGLDLDAAHGVKIRQTGEVALSDDELASVSQGAAWGAAIALAVVAAILYAGLRSWRLMGAALASLVAGLVGTGAFAALTVGTLNLISIAFAVLYIGLGIDYAIHLCLRYREAIQHGQPNASALRTAAADVGPSLWLCALTTAVGFFAFIPTPYDGVAELGLISGTGMFISLVVSLTFLPALIARMRPFRARTLAVRTAWRPPALGPRVRHGVRLGALVLGLACATTLPFVRFDSNTLNLKNPDSESVATYRELLADGDHSPLTLVGMRPDAESAHRLADRLARAGVVSRAMTIDSFVPDDQAAKLDTIGDLGLTLALSPPEMSRTADFDARRRAIAAFANTLTGWRERVASDSEAGRAGARLAETLAGWQRWFSKRSEKTQRSALDRLHDELLGELGARIRSLNTALGAQRVTRQRLPDTIRERWIGRDGSFRVEASPHANLNVPGALKRFVAGARAVAPDITGAPVLEVAAGRTVSRSFVMAFGYASVLITLLLLVLLRSVVDTLRVLAPLGLTSLILFAASVVLSLPFNFANVIALPLLLGVGVDSGIHVVHRLRQRAGDDTAFLASSTARAVLLSSLTTLTGFGSLAFSHHAGTASMGQMLAIGMLAILVTTLILMPSLFGPGERPVNETPRR